MLFSIYALDKPDSLELRLANRPAHFDYVNETGRLKAGGPLLTPDGETMIGSLIILEAEDLDAARAWSEEDPYTKAGLFQSVDIRPWKWVVGAPEA